MPFQMDNGAVVQEENTFIATGGKFKSLSPPDQGLLNTLYRYNPDVPSWDLIEEKYLEIQRWGHNSVFVPDEFIDCI